MRLLITGATGKIGSHLLPALLADNRFNNFRIVVLCHNRSIDAGDRVETVRGSLSDRAVVEEAMSDVTHVIHMAAVKESPDLAMDVSVKGMFLLLEAFRASLAAHQFILIGGDCSVGHIFHRYEGPVTEDSPRRAYPGCYALTKVIEEVMLEQYQIQYGINGCCLRAPWIMEKDDFRYAMTFGDDQFGGPVWTDYLPKEKVEELSRQKCVPVIVGGDGTPLKRNFVHVSDLVTAILCALDNENAKQQLFNISMDEPVDYGRFARYMKKTRGYSAIEIPTDLHSNWLDNCKARLRLNWSPAYDLPKLIESAWTYQRAEDDPRRIWYPG